jgi:restriction endonuclease S subunit
MLARLYQLFKFRSFVFRQLNVCMLAHARSMAEDEENNNLFVYGALVSRSGTVGEVCVVPEGLGDARISTNLMRIVLNPSVVNPQFFCYLFNGSPFVLSQIEELCSGSTRDFLNQKILSLIIFPLPPRKEQEHIVAEVERSLSVISAASRQLKQVIGRSISMRQAILQKAFSGGLVATDPISNASFGEVSNAVSH